MPHLICVYGNLCQQMPCAESAKSLYIEMCVCVSCVRVCICNLYAIVWLFVWKNRIHISSFEVRFLFFFFFSSSLLILNKKRFNVINAFISGILSAHQFCLLSINRGLIFFVVGSNRKIVNAYTHRDTHNYVVGLT